MCYHPIFKTLALIFSAILLVTLFLGALGVIFLLNADLYSTDPDGVLEAAQNNRAAQIADAVVSRYAALQLSDVPPEVLPQVYALPTVESISWALDLEPDSWGYRIQDDQDLLTSVGEVGSTSIDIVCSVPYLILAESDQAYEFRHSHNGQTYYFSYANSPHYLVTVYFQRDAITAAYGLPLSVIDSLYAHRYHILIGMGICLLLLIGCCIYLCLAAGRSRKRDDICPAGLNRLPLDLYGVCTVICCVFLLQLLYMTLDTYELLHFPGTTADPHLLLRLILAGGGVFAFGFLPVGFLCAFAAQFKAPDRFWLRNSLTYRLLALLLRGTRRVLGFLERYFRLLPVMWQWLTVGCAMLLVSILGLVSQEEFVFVFFLLVSLGIVAYGAWAYGTLLLGAKQMVSGKLTAKISTKYLFGSFRDMANQLGCLSNTVIEATNVQMRSERMKAELITNVSHDIKTPLTSIINYTDLLRTAENDKAREEYLQIIEKQGMRLKKLIEDLTQLSRASTGNLKAEIATLDATEALNQALGEFSDKLEKAQLQILTRIPEQPVSVLADGRLLWRVLANLLTNIVKYAQPGTRVYAELLAEADRVQIVLKNISREPLNITAQELQERFVRGDTARNTEGSGLGLSIAASLMEAQQGSLVLKIDGDLFTATLSLPAGK